MTIFTVVILDSTESAALAAESGPGWAFDPRVIDAANPGVSINLNPDADNYDPADVVDLSGKSLVGGISTLLESPVYTQGVRDIVLAAPWCQIDDTVIFAYQEV